MSPDLWLRFELLPSGIHCFAVEVNLTEVSQYIWREKVRAYMFCLDSYEEQFGTDILVVPVLFASARHFPKRLTTHMTDEELADRQRETTRRAKRMADFLKWTEAELQALGAAEQMADLFCFSSVPLDTTSPQDLFLSSHWYEPFSQRPTSLLPPLRDTRSA